MQVAVSTFGGHEILVTIQEVPLTTPRPFGPCPAAFTVLRQRGGGTLVGTGDLLLK